MPDMQKQAINQIPFFCHPAHPNSPSLSPRRSEALPLSLSPVSADALTPITHAGDKVWMCVRDCFLWAEYE